MLVGKLQVVYREIVGANFMLGVKLGVCCQTATLVTRFDSEPQP